MGLIQLHTVIKAPIERCFDLSTSIDLHKLSASSTSEQAVAGVMNGLIKLDETVTWRAKHFGLWHTMQVQITLYQRPQLFVDEMISGSFKFMKHEHEFIEKTDHCLMIDSFDFSSPFGYLCKLVDKTILNRYLTNFLRARNSVIKEFAETDKWKDVLLSK